MAEQEIGFEYFKDLAIGLFFALIGSIGTIVTSIKMVKNKTAVSEAADNMLPETGENVIQESATPIRSSLTDEKVRIYLTATAYGHEIIYRKVGKRLDELLIDGSVYAEYTLAKVQFPFSFHAVLDGHYFEAGYASPYGSYIRVDDKILAKKFRW